jgi:hypothetical protein
MANNALRRAPFVVGMGRSGTTLLRLMLDSHPLLAIPPETHFIGELVRGPHAGSIDLATFHEVLTSSRIWQDFDLDTTRLRQRLNTVPSFSVAKGLRCFYSLYAETQNKLFWGDKTPIYLGLMRDIHHLLPESFFIHLIRDGRDSALSYRGLWFGPGEDLALHAKMWSERIIEGRDQAKDLGGSYLEVRYETLVAEPEKVLKKICTAIGFEFDSSMLEYHLSAHERISQLKARYSAEGSQLIEAERIRNIFKLTSSPPDTSRMGRWRKEMTQEEQMIYEREAGHVLSELGYETYFQELWKNQETCR